MKLSEKQKLWLETRGGRTAHDVFEKDGKQCDLVLINSYLLRNACNVYKRCYN
jgi:hypothetical protein